VYGARVLAGRGQAWGVTRAGTPQHTHASRFRPPPPNPAPKEDDEDEEGGEVGTWGQAPGAGLVRAALGPYCRTREPLRGRAAEPLLPRHISSRAVAHGLTGGSSARRLPSTIRRPRFGRPSNPPPPPRRAVPRPQQEAAPAGEHKRKRDPADEGEEDDEDEGEDDGGDDE
jgi:hypothetical protein